MRIKTFRKIPAAFCLFIFLFPANSPAGADNSVVTLDAIVVTAKKETETLETGDVRKKETPAFHKVIERKDFEGRMEGLSDVIEKEAGIQIRQSGGLGSFSTVSLRGSSAEQVTVYLDGVLMNDASGGGVDLNNISLSDVESVEIYRGISPVNFAKASFGGVVNIRTIRSGKSDRKPLAKATAGYGSFDTRKLSAFIKHKPGKWDYLFSGDYSATDNDFDILNDNGTIHNPHDDVWEARNNEQFDQKDLMAKIGYDFSDTLRLSISDQWFSKDQGLASWNNSRNTNTSLDTDRNTAAIQLTADDLGPLHFNTVTRMDYTDKKEVYDDSEGHIGLGNQKMKYRTKKIGGDFFLEWLTDKNRFGLILTGQRETYATEDLLNRKNPNDSVRNLFSIGLQDSLLLFGDDLIITPAIRYTHIEDELDSAVSSYGIPLSGRSRNEDYLSPQLGFRYQLNRWLNFKSNVARYVREPSFFELFGDRGVFMGNEDLEAEKGVNADAGFEIRKMFGNEHLRRISFHTAFFVSRVDDLITRVYDTRGIGKSDNISESEIKGIEAGLSLDFLSLFRLTGNYTFQDTENQSLTTTFNGKRLPGRFETSFFMKIEARFRGIKVFGEYITEKDMYYDTANLLKAGDREEFNAGFSVLWKKFLVNFEVDNIGDNINEAFNGYPRPGISYHTSITYRY